jgi:CRISPR-associated endoribonuclease Cas6
MEQNNKDNIVAKPTASPVQRHTTVSKHLIMQFKIILQCLDSNPVLPLSYQYELSAWIYSVIEHADAEFSKFLHERGHQTPKRKSFKLFCFSQLNVPRRRVEGDRLHIECPEMSFQIGFYMDRTAEEFIRGLFQSQQFTLGDRLSQARFSVKTVAANPPFALREGVPVRIRLRSPLVVSRKRDKGEPDEYLHPDDPDFGRLLWHNLLGKYEAAMRNPIPPFWDTSGFEFRVVGTEPKSKLITIKSGKSAQTRIKGWMFDFEALAPRELLELGLLAGFGKENAQGFGMGEVVG